MLAIFWSSVSLGMLRLLLLRCGAVVPSKTARELNVFDELAPNED